MKIVRCALAFVLPAMCSALLYAAQVTVHVAGSNGAALNGVLVIVQDLHGNTEQELSRELTDQDGAVTLDDVEPGLYRAIATDPYRSWQTEVEEFLVKDKPVTVTLRLAPRATDDPVLTSVGSLTVRVLDASGRPAVGARVLLRDAEAHPHAERWGTTDDKGTVTLDVTQNSSVLIIVYNGAVHKFPANSFDTEQTVRL